MAKILVFNNDTDRMETYYRGENEEMPYNSNRTLTLDLAVSFVLQNKYDTTQDLQADL